MTSRWIKLGIHFKVSSQHYRVNSSDLYDKCF